MSRFRAKNPYCVRCREPIEGTEESCPACSFSPKDRGMRIAIYCFATVIVGMSIATILLGVYPQVALLAMLLSGLAFVVTVVVMLIAFAATPHRFGRLFLHLENLR